MSSSAKTELNHLLARLKVDYPDVNFIESDHFRWNADKRVVFFSTNTETPVWSLMHEIGHMNSGHQAYSSDLGLLKMEVEAWQKAKQLGAMYGLKADEEYIQDCIDSYRDWLHKRSCCPLCNQNGIEKTKGHYWCINCQASWEVSNSRFCRVYRKTKGPEKIRTFS